MILSDREIQAAIARGSVRIHPPPAATAWSSTAVDLRLDKELRKWVSPGNGGLDTAICPGSPNFNYTKLVGQHTEIIDISKHPYDLEPRQFILGWTVERIQLPQQSRIAARVEGKSSLSRLGLGLHITAPTIHAGFGWNANKPDHPGNPVQLEIWNVGDFKIRLVPGIAICQLIFEEVHGTPEKGYQGMFSVQGPQT